MKYIYKLQLVAALLSLALSQFVCAETQKLTIVGTSASEGQIDPYAEGSTDGGSTWGAVYSVGLHPWQNNGGVIAPEWVNVYPSTSLGLNQENWIRIRFNMPSEYNNPSMVFKMKADRYASVSLNNNALASVEGAAIVNGDFSPAKIATILKPGLNEILMRLNGGNGRVAFQYFIEIAFQSQYEAVLGKGGSDADADGLKLEEEINYVTNPNKSDTDDDGVFDGVEIANGTDPRDPKSGPIVRDTDEDGVEDSEDAFPFDPNESVDSDDDGIGDGSDAFLFNSNEWADSDGDGVGDNADFFPYDGSRSSDPNKEAKKLTIVATSAPSGSEDSFSQASTDGGQTWGPVYSVGAQPGQHFGEVIAPRWVSVYPSPTVDQGQENQVRLRFSMPSKYRDPSIILKVKSYYPVSAYMNGVYLALFENFSVIDGDLSPAKIATIVKPGINEIILRLNPDENSNDVFQYFFKIMFKSDNEAVIGKVGDTDVDGLTDQEETLRYKTNPNKADTDGDGIFDGVEVANGTDPLNPLDPNKPTIVDTDGDGYADNVDVFPNDPKEWADADGDGVGDNADVNDASDMSEFVFVGDVNSGVENFVYDNGETLADLINGAYADCSESTRDKCKYTSCIGVINSVLDCLQSARYKYEFSSCMIGFINGLYTEGEITKEEKDLLQAAVTKAIIKKDKKSKKDKKCKMKKRGKHHHCNDKHHKHYNYCHDDKTYKNCYDSKYQKYCNDSKHYKHYDDCKKK
jgi:hypothetical protein